MLLLSRLVCFLRTVRWKKEYKLEHYQQRYEWDCGLSCILMILPTPSRLHFLEHFAKICETEGFGTSTWTIDLCYVLKRYNIRHVYLTKTLGVDPTYLQQHTYYIKIISKDQDRVNEKFKNAESNGITVDMKTVDFESLIKHLSSCGPLIVLTNASLLQCDVCKNGQYESGYSGHYVVLCGFNRLRKKILYRNPAKYDHVCKSSFKAMDKARKAHGTDEDVIFIFNGF